MSGPIQGRSVGDLLADLVTQFSALLRSEGQLARVEISEKVGQAALGLGLVVGSAVLLIPALVIILMAAVAALIEAGIAQQWAALIVGGVTLIIGIVIGMIGINRLKGESLVPERVVHQLKKDAYVAKQQTGISHEPRYST
jgi:uncharacterized membrane protein YqjE